MLSPLSARIALAMAYNGASDEVAEEMAYVLDFADMSLDEVNAMMRGIIDSLVEADANVQLEMANSIWSDDECAFLEDFRARCVKSYDAEVASVDLDGPEAAGIIDAWVSEKTHGKIPEIAGSFDLENIGAMLINALYLKGAWTYQFDPSGTVADSFTLSDGEVKKGPLHEPSRRLQLLREPGLPGSESALWRRALEHVHLPSHRGGEPRRFRAEPQPR